MLFLSLYKYLHIRHALHGRRSQFFPSFSTFGMCVNGIPFPCSVKTTTYHMKQQLKKHKESKSYKQRKFYKFVFYYIIDINLRMGFYASSHRFDATYHLLLLEHTKNNFLLYIFFSSP